MRGAKLVRLSLIALLSLVLLGAPTYGANPVEYDLQIPQQSLRTALQEFSRQTGVQIIFFSKLTDGLEAQPLSGKFTAAGALQRLLNRSELTFRELNAKTIQIELKSAATDTKPSHRSSAAGEGAQTTITGVGAVSGSQSLDSVDSQLPATRNSGLNAGANDAANGKLDEITVTGSHISGVVPAGSALTVYTREDMQKSGATTLADFARIMPQNFSDTDAISNLASNSHFALGSANNNSYNGAGFNLHGLGAGATLTLLNGHRLAAAGTDGGFVDISVIPFSAIDHIEVLTDGASAVYGSDAISGVVNIITRKDFEGFESHAQYGSSTRGGADTLAASQTWGTAWESGNIFLNYDYNWNGGLDARQRDYIAPLGGPYSLIPADRRNSFFLAGSQSLGDHTSLSGDAIYSARHFASSETDFTSDYTINLPSNGKAEMYGLSLSVDHSFSNTRHVSLVGSYSKLKQTENFVFDFEAPGDSEVSPIVVVNVTKAASLDAVGDGVIAALPGGAMRGAVGVGYRAENYVNEGFVSLQRHVVSEYMEIFIPVVGAQNAVPGINRLEISAAGRHDQYSDFGSTSNPKVGVVWSPIVGYDLRASYGRSFRAPLLSELGGAVVGDTFLIDNPNSPTGMSDFLNLAGGNTRLGPERATVVTTGFAVHPSAIPSFSASIDYFNINYSQRIQKPPLTSSFVGLFQNNAIAPFLNLNPPLATVENYFNSPTFAGDFAELGPSGVEAIYNGYLQNLASSKESGLNLMASYELATPIGDLSWSINFNRLLRLDLRSTSDSPPVALLNAFGEPNRTRARADMSWKRGPLAALLAANYIGDYQNTLFQPSEPIERFLTYDLFLSYKTDNSPSISLLRNLTVSLNVNNLSDKRPPTVQIPAELLGTAQTFVPFDSSNASPVGRFILLGLTKRWGLAHSEDKR
jgi:iron complex outermembrane receptor protein